MEQKKDMRRAGNHRTHGMTGTPTHRTWLSMKRRCDNPNASNFYLYGGRGIGYEPKWKHFENFLEDMGVKPNDELSLERIDNSLGYSKDNCIWADRNTQASNKRNNRYIEHNGERLTLSQWARKANISTRTLFARLNVQGWDFEKAITTKPVIGRNQYGE